MTWDAVQREVLEALGHTLYCRTVPEQARIPDDPLLRALLRAASRTGEDAEVPALVRDWPPTTRLRGDPAAKRALWPRLRALRAGR